MRRTVLGAVVAALLGLIYSTPAWAVCDGGLTAVYPDQSMCVAGAVTLDSTLGITGALECDSSLGVDGAFRVGAAGASKFDVVAASGNTQIDGTCEVDGTLGADGNFRVGASGASLFDITAATGALQCDAGGEFDGALGVDGAFRVGASGASLFDVAAATGNTQIDGTLEVDGAAGVDGNLRVGAAGASSLLFTVASATLDIIKTKYTADAAIAISPAAGAATGNVDGLLVSMDNSGTGGTARSGGELSAIRVVPTTNASDSASAPYYGLLLDGATDSGGTSSIVGVRVDTGYDIGLQVASGTIDFVGADFDADGDATIKSLTVPTAKLTAAAAIAAAAAAAAADTSFAGVSVTLDNSGAGGTALTTGSGAGVEVTPTGNAGDGASGAYRSFMASTATDSGGAATFTAFEAGSGYDECLTCDSGTVEGLSLDPVAADTNYLSAMREFEATLTCTGGEVCDQADSPIQFGPTLPAGAMLHWCVIAVTTEFTSDTMPADAAVVALGIDGDTSGIHAGVTHAVARYDGVPVWTVASEVGPLASAQKVIATVTVDNVASGVLKVHCTYDVP